VIAFEFVIDEAYHREFHGEMVATQLPRWRLHRRVAWASAGLAVVLLAWTVASGRADTLCLAVGVALVAAGLWWRLHRRRAVWLRTQRRQRGFGAHLTVRVEDGQLVQTDDRGGATQCIRWGEVVESPRGWFVTYDTVFPSTDLDAPATEVRDGTAYLPRRGLDEGVSRDDVARALEATFALRRR